jgi:hypothetical protein
MLTGMCASPTGGDHGRTARGPAQREGRARQLIKARPVNSMKARVPKDPGPADQGATPLAGM